MTLRSVLEGVPEVRRIFGERELEIIRKQLSGIALTPSETTRLSRDVRKKFYAISRLARFENEFSLKKGADTSRIIEETKGSILDSKWRHKIKKIYLYGSVVDGSLTFYSDVDLAVEFDSADKAEAAKFRINVLGKANGKADVQVFNVLPNSIKKEILSKGKIIFEEKNKEKENDQHNHS